MSINNKKSKYRLFKSLKFQFIFYFLIFSFVPLAIFSILGFFLNQNIVENIHQSKMENNGAHLSKRLIDFFSIKDYLAKSYFIIYIVEENTVYPKSLKEQINILPERKDSNVIIFKEDAIVSNQVIPEKQYTRLKAALGKPEYNLVFLADNKIFYKTKIDDDYYVFQSIEINKLYSILDLSDQSINTKLVSIAGDFSISGEGIELAGDNEDKEINESVLSGVIHIDNDLILYYSKSKAGIYSELKSFLAEILLANFAIGLLVLLGAIYFSRRIITPIESLANAVKKISKGDLNEPVTIKSEDEIKALAEEFEKMRLKLRESYVDLENKIEERTQALRDAQFQISHQEKMASLGLLAAGVAHEIGNPLTSISSMAQIIKRKVKDQNFIEYLNTILKNIERIRQIVRELVDFARPSSYEATDTNINEIIRNAVGIVKYDRRTRSINIELELDNQLPPVFLVADQLLQVFINILINAVDALSEDKNRIIIRTKKQNTDIIIQFEDEGVGIEPENLSKIFEPFYTTKKVGKGTGLGLSVSYGIIKNLNGSIDVESQPGQGSIFTIRLPFTDRST